MPSPRRAVQGRPDAGGPRCHCVLSLLPPRAGQSCHFSVPAGATSLTVHPDGTQALGERGVHPPLLLPGRWPHPAGPQVPHLWCSCLPHAPPQAPRAFCHQWSGVGFLQAEPRAPAATLTISSYSVPTGYCGDQPEEHETLYPVQLTFAPLSSRRQASPQQIRTDLVSQP